jgi:Generalcontrol nonderepressible 1 (Gcn1) N-terminal
MGMMFLYLGMNSQSHNLQRELVRSLENHSSLFPEVLNSVIVDSLTAFLSLRVKRLTSKTSSDEVDPAVDHQPQFLSKILSTCASFNEATDINVRKTLLTNLIALAHNSQICEFLSSHYIVLPHNFWN